MVFVSPLSGRLIARFGARLLMSAGMVLGVAGCWSSPACSATSPDRCCSPVTSCSGLALGLVYAPMSTAAMAAMPADKFGIAARVLAMDRVLARRRRPGRDRRRLHALLGGHGFAGAVAGSTWVAVVLAPSGRL